MHSTTVLWEPIEKEFNKTDNGGTVNINNICTYIVRKYVNEINNAYVYMQKYTSTKLKSSKVVCKTTQIKLHIIKD